MSRIAILGSASQAVYLLDRDDFVGVEVAGSSIFSKIEIGSTIDIDKVTFDFGGAGLGAAFSCARAGHNVSLLTSLAHDPAGEAIVAALDEEGIATDQIEFSEKISGFSVVLLDLKTKQNTLLSHRTNSTNFHHLSPKSLEEVQPEWLFVSSLNGDMDTLLDFFETAHKINCKIMFAPGPAELSQPEKLIGVLSEVDILALNKESATKLVPGRVLSEISSHLSNYCETVLLTDGASGGFATNHKDSYRFGLYEDVKIKDRLGSGIAFSSGFLSAYASGKTFEESLIYASANASSVISSIGIRDGLIPLKTKLHPMPIQKVE